MLARAQQAPVQQAPIQQTSIQLAPVEQTPVKQIIKIIAVLQLSAALTTKVIFRYIAILKGE